jgi:hypothetical protein
VAVPLDVRVKSYVVPTTNAVGRFATTWVEDALTTVSGVPPNATAGDAAKFVPAIVNCAGVTAKFALALVMTGPLVPPVWANATLAYAPAHTNATMHNLCITYSFMS